MATFQFDILFSTTFLILVITTPSMVASSSPPQSIYDVLKSHGLPVGVLPNGISDFSIDPTSGRFVLRLPRSCAAQFETHVRYDASVSGIISYGQISDLSGVTAQELFLWLPVKGIRVDVPSSGLIYFDVGFVFKQFSLSFFETPRDCVADEQDNSSVSSLAPGEIVLFHDRAELARKNVESSGKYLRIAAS